MDQKTRNKRLFVGDCPLGSMELKKDQFLQLLHTAADPADSNQGLTAVRYYVSRDEKDMQISLRGESS